MCVCICIYMYMYIYIYTVCVCSSFLGAVWPLRCRPGCVRAPHASPRRLYIYGVCLKVPCAPKQIKAPFS